MAMEGKKIRVLHVASGDLYAGAERMVEELAIAQAAMPDVRVIVVLMNDGILASRLREASVETICLEERRRSALSLLLSLRSIIKEQGVAIVHTHRFKEHILGSLASIGIAASVRTVHGLQEFRRQTSMKGLAIDLMDNICARFLQKPIVCVSEELRERYGEIYKGSRPTCIRNGIDRGRLINAASLPVPQLRGKVLLGVFARLVPVKKIDVAIAVARQVRSKLGDGVVLHIFGDGPLRDSLEQQANGCGGIVFHGNTDDAPAYLEQIQALLLPSEHEGMPVAVMEAMALGIPVVASRVGGLPELLADGERGWLVEAGSVQGFAEAVCEVVMNHAERVRRAKNALQYAEEALSARRMAAEYLLAYSIRDGRMRHQSEGASV